MISEILSFIGNSMLLNNIILAAFFGGFLFLFLRENNNTTTPLRWTDLIVDEKTGKFSLSRLGQFWGIAISSWVVVYMVQVPAAYAIFPMVFTAWLAYLLGGYSFNKFLNKKDEKKDD
jgi:hypothetical protein